MTEDEIHGVAKSHTRLSDFTFTMEEGTRDRMVK